MVKIYRKYAEDNRVLTWKLSTLNYGISIVPQFSASLVLLRMPQFHPLSALGLIWAYGNLNDYIQQVADPTFLPFLLLCESLNLHLSSCTAIQACLTLYSII
jgi:hypothetical protein